LRIDNAHAAKKVLWVIRIYDVAADTHASLLPVADFPHEIRQRVTKPRSVAKPERPLPG